MHDRRARVDFFMASSLSISNVYFNVKLLTRANMMMLYNHGGITLPSSEKNGFLAIRAIHENIAFICGISSLFPLLFQTPQQSGTVYSP